ncbi:MAG: ATP-binding protein, partial [Gemmatimonadota bacterium]
PGTGKTWFAKATAKEAGVQFLQLNLGSLLNMYVGNSEARLDKALRAIWHLGGICLIDELDQQLSSRGPGAETGSSVDNRFLGRLLAFMAEPQLKGRVVFLAATNRPDLLDAALKRSGRFDRKVPFLPPTAPERAGVIAAQLRFQDIHVEARLVAGLEALASEKATEPELAEALEDLVEATDGWVHSDFQNLVGKAWELAQADDGLVSAEALREAAHLLIPSGVEEHMLAVSLAEVNDLSLLPEAYRAQAQERRPSELLTRESTRRTLRS